MRKKWIVTALACMVLAIGIEAYLLMTAVQGANQVTAYVLTTPCLAEETLQKSKLKAIQIPAETAESLETLALEKLVGQKVAEDLPLGKLLTKKDFEIHQNGEALQTMVVKLNPEQSHIGALEKNEVIDLICYRQGVITRIEGLSVRAVQPIATTGGEGMAYVTLAGTVAHMETILLSQQEGVVSILKKTTVQIP